MKKAAIDKCRRRIRTAEKAITAIESPKDYSEFEENWSIFLSSFKSIYTTLHKGARNHPQARQWVGGKDNERRGDPLLQYLYQARNHDEHGIEPITELTPGSTAIGFKGGGVYHIHSMTVRRDKDGTTIVGNVSAPRGGGLIVKQTAPRVRLIRVTDRESKPVDPPTHHLGTALPDDSPLTAAKTAIGYIRSLVDLAERFVSA